LIILKLDFEKAFDKVEHQLMLKVMEHKGFGTRWLSWMRMIFGSETSSVLLNGVPEKVFHCKKGYPLSSLLFVLAADLLQSVINDAKNQGLINLPIPERAGTDFPNVQYVLIILEGCEQ
jgi:hypothetical protein